MIEVLLSNGDSAEAETPEDAVYAARVMVRDVAAAGLTTTGLTASFYVDGRLVRERVRSAEL